MAFEDRMDVPESKWKMSHFREDTRTEFYNEIGDCAFVVYELISQRQATSYVTVYETGLRQGDNGWPQEARSLKDIAENEINS